MKQNTLKISQSSGFKPGNRRISLENCSNDGLEPGYLLKSSNFAWNRQSNQRNSFKTSIHTWAYQLKPENLLKSVNFTRNHRLEQQKISKTLDLNMNSSF